MIPMFRIIEDSNTKDPQMRMLFLSPTLYSVYIPNSIGFFICLKVELQNLAKEIQEFLREKVGTNAFSHMYGQLRTIAIEKRQARKRLIALKVS